jgi:hypothetical protein
MKVVQAQPANGRFHATKCFVFSIATRLSTLARMSSYFNLLLVGAIPFRNSSWAACSIEVATVFQSRFRRAPHLTLVQIVEGVVPDVADLFELPIQLAFGAAANTLKLLQGARIISDYESRCLPIGGRGPAARRQAPRAEGHLRPNAKHKLV